MNKKITTFFSLLWVGLLLGAVQVQAQDCSPHTANTDGPMAIVIDSESGECFQFYFRGELLTPDYVSRLNFKTEAGSHKVKCVLKNGAVIEKKFLLSPDQANALYNIKSKKGKYVLKQKFTAAEYTPEAKARKEKEEAERKAKLQADKERRDKEWEDAQAERKAKREAEMSKSSGATLSEYEDTRQGVQGQQLSGKQGRTDLATSSSSGSNGSTGSSGNSGSSKGSTGSSSIAAGNSGSNSAGGTIDAMAPGPKEVPMWITYKGAPITNTEVTLEISGVVIGTGTTDSEGKVKIKTNLPVNTETSYKLSGKKGNAKWSFSGLFLLNPLPKVTPVPMEVVVKEMASAMGMGESMLVQMWGLE